MRGKVPEYTDFSQHAIDQMCLDYIKTNITAQQFAGRWHISLGTAQRIIHKHELVKKRKEWRGKVLDRAMEKAVEQQADIVAKTTNILHGHVLKMNQIMMEGKATSQDVRDILSIFNTFAKEYRLDNGKPTDATVSQVDVNFSGGFGSLGESVDVEYHEVTKEDVQNMEKSPKDRPKSLEESKPEESDEDVEVDVDDSILGGSL